MSKEFETWLGDSQKTIDSKIKAIICPHAGYAYCGPTAAYSYHHVDASQMLTLCHSLLLLSMFALFEMNPNDSPITNLIRKRVFILGPDHCGATHHALHRCMLSGATHWQTPFGDIQVDTDVIAELHGTKQFDMLSMKQDANEHVESLYSLTFEVSVSLKIDL